MCNYIYQIHRECGHRTIQLNQPCREAYFTAGLTLSFMSACPELPYGQQLANMIKGKKLDGDSVWNYWEGYCQYCIHNGLAPKDFKNESQTAETIPLYSFLPVHNDYKLWLYALEKELKIKGSSLEFLVTINHPFVLSKIEIVSLPTLLGVENQPEANQGQVTPMIHINRNLRKWDPQENTIQRWIIHCDIKLGSEWFVEHTQTKNWALVRNKGQTRADNEFVNASLAKGIDWETIYHFKFQSRGMLKSTFKASLLKPHFTDGPNPVDDLLQAFDWNDLCRATLGYEHLVIPIPPAAELARTLAWNNICQSVPGQEHRQISMLVMPRLPSTSEGSVQGSQGGFGEKKPCELDDSFI